MQGNDRPVEKPQEGQQRRGRAAQATPGGQGQQSEAAAAQSTRPERPPRAEGQQARGSGRPARGERASQPAPGRGGPGQGASRRREGDRPGRAEGQGARAPQQSQGPAVPAVPRLLKKYRENVAPQMMREFNYGAPLQAPRLEKVVLNVGLGEALTNPNAIENVTNMLATVSGQRPVVTRAKKSIASFKIREGMQIGVMVTLRSRRMYEFVDRLLNSALPRIRDFQGVSPRSFDGRGNYSLGIREQVIFPEIDYNRVDRIRGFQVSFATTARSDREAYRLLELMGMPFAKS
ncbi:MAG: 50S ribosomal protein L5 [Chloroflexi bacterium]|nr:50S ribosomal protein L5 [Chloroflexota bacterium]